MVRVKIKVNVDAFIGVSAASVFHWIPSGTGCLLCCGNILVGDVGFPFLSFSWSNCCLFILTFFWLLSNPWEKVLEVMCSGFLCSAPCIDLGGEKIYITYVHANAYSRYIFLLLYIHIFKKSLTLPKFPQRSLSKLECTKAVLSADPRPSPYCHTPPSSHPFCCFVKFCVYYRREDRIFLFFPLRVAPSSAKRLDSHSLFRFVLI